MAPHRQPLVLDVGDACVVLTDALHRVAVGTVVETTDEGAAFDSGTFVAWDTMRRDDVNVIIPPDVLVGSARAVRVIGATIVVTTEANTHYAVEPIVSSPQLAMAVVSEPPGVPPTTVSGVAAHATAPLMTRFLAIAIMLLSNKM